MTRADFWRPPSVREKLIKEAEVPRLVAVTAVLAVLGLGACGGSSTGRTASSTVEPAIGQGTAAPCSSFAQGRVGRIRLASDTPEPRCIRLHPDQRLRIVNISGARGQHPRVATIDLGPHHTSLAQGEGATFGAVGHYLAAGDHVIRTSLYGGGGGPEVFVARGATDSGTGARPPVPRTHFSAAVYPQPLKPANHGGLAFGCPNPRGVQPLGPHSRAGALAALRSITGNRRRDRQVADRAFWPNLRDWKHRPADKPDPGSGPATTSPYRGIARSKCGGAVVNRSWSFVLGPRDPGLESTVFLLQRRGHWLIWFEYP